jgi:hypothetical protein
MAWLAGLEKEVRFMVSEGGGLVEADDCLAIIDYARELERHVRMCKDNSTEITAKYRQILTDLLDAGPRVPTP